MTMKYNAVFFTVIILILASCEKYKDVPGDPNNPLLQRPYCNDPAGVNYNWDFPGKPDNATCIYPADVFVGNYTYTDSIYDASQSFIRAQVLNLNVSSSGQEKIAISGFCPGSSISLTASRRLRADADTVVGFGQLLCRPTDTVTGAISRPDITGSVLFDFTVISDTGLNYHRGSAVKQ